MAHSKKKFINMRMSDKGIALKKKIAEQFGLTETAVVEMAIRELADKLGVTVDDAKPKDALFIQLPLIA